MVPQKAFIRLESQNDWWPQSCEMMKRRTAKPAAGIASRSVSR